MVAIVIIALVLLFLSFDACVQWGASRRLARMPPASRAIEREDDSIDGARLDPRHVWVRPSWLGRSLWIGADRFAELLLGPSFGVQVVSPTHARHVREGDVIARLVNGQRVIEVRSPCSGVVDRGLEPSTPRSSAPHSSAACEALWLVRIRPSEPLRALPQMRSGAAARRWLHEELKRLRDLLVEATASDPIVGATAVDGGLPLDALAASLDDATFERLKDAFFGRGDAVTNANQKDASIGPGRAEDVRNR